MKIESNDRDIQQVLGSGYLRIPRFQRSYSWELAEVEDFWNDTINEADSDYFIGSIVVFRVEHGVFGIVDGQQRLTTITMILCSLRNHLDCEGSTDLAEGLHRLIERPDLNNQKQYVLQTETSYPYFQERIQSQRWSDTSSDSIGEEERRIKRGFEYIDSQVAETIKSVKVNPSLGESEKVRCVKRELTNIRDRLLRLKVIFVVLDSEGDAYTIFETLNTRGRDLTVSDLVRTQITRLLPQKNRNVDRPKERFNSIIERFEESAADISINSFLHHYWLSKYEYTTEKKLYKAFRKQIRTVSAARDFLSDLEDNASLYRILHEPNARRWTIEEHEIRDSLRALNLFRVRQQIPFSLSVLCEWKDKEMSLKQARRALAAVESFHFLFTAVTSQRSSGGISFMYALHARNLRDASTRADKTKETSDLVQKLRDKLPSFQEFEADFCGILCSEKHTKRKALVQYILRRMTAENLKGISVDWAGMTIEHLASQSSGGGTDLPEDLIAQIGNLILVDQPLNEQLRAKKFDEKLAILKGSPVWLDEYTREQTSWGSEQIRLRGKYLAKLAFHGIWKF